MLPDSIRPEVEAALRLERGRRVRIARASSVGGGCVSPAVRLELDDGSSAFLKWSADGAPADFFSEEARSLRAIDAARAARVPRVAGVASNWLLLEWIEPGAATAETWLKLGRQLARLHGVRAAAFGWEADNYIGSLPQRNARHDRWSDFWREERLIPQWRKARDAGHFGQSDESTFDRLLVRVEDVLRAGDADGPSLLHGDLWRGNVYLASEGEAVLIDPSCYHGHREVDLAMAELFGGFDAGFMDAYDETWPLAPGYRERRPVYQLYYLLVHVNLFGESYVAGARAAMRAGGRDAGR